MSKLTLLDVPSYHDATRGALGKATGEFTAWAGTAIATVTPATGTRLRTVSLGSTSAGTSTVTFTPAGGGALTISVPASGSFSEDFEGQLTLEAGSSLVFGGSLATYFAWGVTGREE